MTRAHHTRTTEDPAQFAHRTAPYVHVIADIGAHRHVRYRLATCQVLRQFAPDKALALEIAPRSIRYAFPRGHTRDDGATPADRPDVAVFLTDPTGDLSARAHAHLLRLIENRVPVWRVIPVGENNAGVHPPASYRFEPRSGDGWSYVHVEQTP